MLVLSDEKRDANGLERETGVGIRSYVLQGVDFKDRLDIFMREIKAWEGVLLLGEKFYAWSERIFE